MLRKLFSKLSNSFNQSVVSPRQSYQAPLKVWFEPRKATGSLEMPGQVSPVHGTTCNVSETGIAFIVSSIRVRENYLVGDGRTLNAELELPDGRIRMQVMGRRYERLDDKDGAGRYLVGASIEAMSEGHRQLYESFVRSGIRRAKRGGAVVPEEA
jgi:hypothetical protein